MDHHRWLIGVPLAASLRSPGRSFFPCRTSIICSFFPRRKRRRRGKKKKKKKKKTEVWFRVLHLLLSASLCSLNLLKSVERCQYRRVRLFHLDSPERRGGDRRAASCSSKAQARYPCCKKSISPSLSVCLSVSLSAWRRREEEEKKKEKRLCIPREVVEENSDHADSTPR